MVTVHEETENFLSQASVLEESLRVYLQVEGSNRPDYQYLSHMLVDIWGRRQGLLEMARKRSDISTIKAHNESMLIMAKKLISAMNEFIVNAGLFARFSKDIVALSATISSEKFKSTEGSIKALIA